MPPFSNSTRSNCRIQYAEQQGIGHGRLSSKYRMSPIPERFVSFNDDIQVLEVPLQEEPFPQENSASWYSNQELTKISREITYITRHMDRKTLRSQDCVRGLESRAARGFQRTRKVRINSLYALLSEQLKQEQLETANQENLRLVCSSISAQSVEEAIAMARIDEADALLYQGEKEDHQDDQQPLKCWIFSPPAWLSLPRKESPFMEIL